MLYFLTDLFQLFIDNLCKPDFPQITRTSLQVHTYETLFEATCNPVVVVNDKSSFKNESTHSLLGIIDNVVEVSCFITVVQI
jgi:hypothetical protein